jgi:trans-2,3-dihydro-3-hydroxyanthranilate isomerase
MSRNVTNGNAIHSARQSAIQPFNHNESMSALTERIELEYFIVDVFTSTPLAGNPLAVVFDTVGLSDERMQAVAREFNLSETTFIQRRPPEVEAAEGVRVRIFTTQEELPFAGHPTLGTSSVLKLHAPETVREKSITLALNVGPVPVRFSEPDSGSSPDAIFGEMTQRDPEFGAELDAADVSRLIGVAAADLDPSLTPQMASTGNPFAIVVLRSLEALARLRVDHDLATPWLRERGGRWFYVLAPAAGAQDSSANPRFRARMQFYGGEDPATGSAAGCAISYLVARGAVQPDVRILLRQGVEMGRTSDLFLSAGMLHSRVTDVRVAGSTVPVARGSISVP